MTQIPEAIAALITPGSNAAEIARRTGLPYYAIWKHMREEGIAPGRQGIGQRSGRKSYDAILHDLRDPRATLQQIGDRHGVTRERIRQIAAKFGVTRDGANIVIARDRKQRHAERIAANHDDRAAHRLMRWAPFIEMREQGATFRGIAAVCGVTATAAHKAITGLRPDLRSRGVIVPHRKNVAPRAHVDRLPSYPNRKWTDDERQALRGFWDEGLLTSQIGRRMQHSKNSIIGEAHRLNLPARPSPIRRAA